MKHSPNRIQIIPTMHVSTTRPPEPPFRPVSIVITVESLEEAQRLYTLFNSSAVTSCSDLPTGFFSSVRDILCDNVVGVRESGGAALLNTRIKSYLNR